MVLWGLLAQSVELGPGINGSWVQVSSRAPVGCVLGQDTLSTFLKESGAH